jgi:hypothetical protein
MRCLKTKNDAVRLKIIKDTVFNSILSEMNDKLASKITDEKKRLEIIKFTRSRLHDILNSLNQDELLPKRDIKSEQDFEKHILKVIQQIRQRLVSEIEKEF